MILKIICVGAAEATPWFRAPAAPPEGFSSQHSDGSSRPPVTPVPGDSMPSGISWALAHIWCADTHTGRQDIFTHKDDFFKKAKTSLFPPCCWPCVLHSAFMLFFFFLFFLLHISAMETHKFEEECHLLSI